ncbi:D-2-hydroxyacid dehydrogenase [Gemmatimonas groenlandica]|uniref:D-2-hydroxyacid dehydrogenase n=1 Tax=Gemmatimonas groenlandica TaxID=2732249 RepID=A0A6M4IPK8_9BACT|nr:D-2-hydroxyacid dehydrogenase [Gemmatimonas groenlandica]QJR35888.1 D-2-hydroxyacid dehydrogenase [Gemmatimonas groenlandica]
MTETPGRRRLVVDLQSTSPHMRVPLWAAERIAAAAPDGWEVVHIASPSKSIGSGSNMASDETLAVITRAEGYLGYGVPAGLLQAAPHLGWAHSAAAGVGASVTPELRASGVVFTNSAGVYGEPMADTVLAGVLHFVRGLDFATRQQAASTWNQLPFIHRDLSARAEVRELAELRVLIVGAGGIGTAVARRFSALGCRCVGIRRRPELGAPEGFARVEGPGALDAELPDADVLVLAAPLTGGSASLLDARRLALLPAGAIVVNVARGALVSDEALLDSLNRNHLRGAVLDVFNTEPLPVDNPYWQHPKVLVTPHVSGVSPQHWRRVLELFEDNWRRWQAGTPLRNVVDLDAGY